MKLAPATTLQALARFQVLLADQAMVVRSIWKSARACRAVAGASFEGSLKKILKGLEHQNIKMSSLDMTEKITFSGIKV